MTVAVGASCDFLTLTGHSSDDDRHFLVRGRHALVIRNDRKSDGRVLRRKRPSETQIGVSRSLIIVRSWPKARAGGDNQNSQGNGEAKLTTWEEAAAPPEFETPP